MEEDRRLLRGMRRGDQAALRRLYEKHKDDLLTVAVSLTLDMAAAEDVLHDVFVRFAENANGLHLRSSLKAYLATSVANRARDRFRAAHTQDVSLEGVADVPAVPVDPAGRLIRLEEGERLYKALAMLPYEQREVITLHLHGELRFREIAADIGVSINTVQSRYRYGLEKLRTLLGSGVGA